MDVYQAIAKSPLAKGVFLGVILLSVLISVYVWWSQLHRTVPVETPQPGVSVVTIMFTPQGFVPADVKIKSGTTVTFLQGSEDAPMWVASNNHEEHALYSGTAKERHCPDTSGTAFDQCAKGVSYSFTFRKTGTWGYHNHMNPEFIGRVVVTE